MNSDPQGRKPAARRRGGKSPAHGDEGADISQEGLDSVLDSFKRLVQAAADTGRDWKLVDALLQTMIELVLETRGDLFASTEAQASEPSRINDAEAPHAGTSAQPRLRLRAEYRLRLAAVIDSWSDDETADFLLIGARQVRRRAQQGTLYYFRVNRKRRYPVWQFDTFCGVVGGVAEVGRAFPDSWPPERVYAFMTTRSPVLNLVTPAQWLLLKRDPNRIVVAITNSRET